MIRLEVMGVPRGHMCVMNWAIANGPEMTKNEYTGLKWAVIDDQSKWNEITEKNNVSACHDGRLWK